MQDIINGECSQCYRLALTKACLLHWSIHYRLVNNGLFKVSPDFHQSLLLGRVMYWLLVCSYMQPQVLYSTMIRCGLIGNYESGEVKSGVS